MACRSGLIAALLVLCATTRAWAAVGLVQHATNSVSGVSTNTVTVTVAATGTGNLIVVLGAGRPSTTTITGVTDNATGGSNTYIQVPSARATASGPNAFTDVWYAKNSKGGATTVTVTYSVTDTNFKQAFVMEAFGVHLSAPVDVAATVNNGVDAGPTATGASVTTTNANDFIAAVNFYSGSLTGIQGGNPFTETDLASGHSAAYLPSPSIGTYTPQWADPGGGTFAASTVAFKAGVTKGFEVGTLTKSTSAAPATQVISHGLGQVPKAVILWTEGRPDSTFSGSNTIAFRAAASATAASGVLTLTINKPAGTVQNDVMIAAIGVQPNTATITAPAGWTLFRKSSQGTATANALATYYRVAGASEGASYSWTFSASTGSAGGIASFSGVDVTAPIDVENGQVTASSLNHAAPTVTTTSTNDMVVTAHTISSSITWTPPAGMTEVVDVRSAALGNAGQSLEINYVAQAAIGATGAKTAVASANADTGATDTITLRPAYQSYFAFGLSDGTTDGSGSSASRSGVATAVVARRMADKALTVVKWDQTVLAEADLQSWDATSFTLNWTTNDSLAYSIHYLLIAGPDVSAKVVRWQMPTATGNVSVSTIGFQPTAVINLHTGSGFTATPPASAVNSGFGLGVMDFGGTQWATEMFAVNGTTGGDTQRAQATDAAIYCIDSAQAVTKKGSFVSMDASGFTMNFTTANANAGQVYSLALLGVNVKAGTFLKSTAAAPASQSVTGTGFAPSAVFFHSFQDVTQAAPVANSRMSYGASDGVTQASSAFADLDLANPTNFQAIDKTTKALMKVNNSTATTDAEADLTSLDTDGFTLNWTTNDAVATEVLYMGLANLLATEVRLISFDASRYDKGVLVRWRTGYETNNLGFNVYREVDGVRTKVNQSLIAGSALQAVNAELNYASWDVDPAASSGSVVYWLEDVDFNGTRTLHGPVAPGANALQAQGPIATSSTSLGDLGDTGHNRTVVFDAPDDPIAVGRRDTQWDLAAQRSIKIAVHAPGWYRVAQPDLVAAGLDPAVDPHRLRLFLDGIEQAIRVTGEADGRFDAGDAIEFYGTGVDTPFTDTQVYWLAAGAEIGRRLTVNAEPATGPPAPAGFAATRQLKDRSIYFAALKNGDAENWFGAVVSPDPTELTLQTANVDRTAGAAQLSVSLQGVTGALDGNGGHAVTVSVNGSAVGEVDFEGKTHATQTLAVPLDTLQDGDNTITLVSGDDLDVSLVDTIAVTYSHAYRADADVLRFTVDPGLAATVGGFASPAIHIVDITDPMAVVELQGTIQPDVAGLFAMTVQAAGSGSRTLFAFTDSTVATPLAVGANQPSSWHAATNAYDYVVVSHRDFVGPVAPLAGLRAQQGHHVAVVDIDDVYDEFSFGEKTPQALRDFLQWARGTWTEAPRFVVLVGDATIDPRDYSQLGGADFVPTRQIAMNEAALETASDDWFVDFDDNGLPDVAIGRLSVRTPAQADDVVRKIVGYDAGEAGPWTKRVLLVADRNDGLGNFERSSQSLADALPAGYTATTVFRGTLGDDVAHQTLIDRVNDGQIVVNYIGHGSVHVWSDGAPPLLQNPSDGQPTNDVAQWRNSARLPLVVAMNCLNGLFNGIWDEESLAEALQRAPDGGAVAVWASSSVTSAFAQARVDQELFRLLFSGAYPTVGEAIVAAKRAVASPDLRRSWIYFGDPAMHLSGAPVGNQNPAPPVPDPAPPAPSSGGGAGGGGSTSPAPSAETPTPTPPNAPTDLTSVVTGTSLLLSWTAPASGAAPLSYVVEAGTFTGARDVVVDTGILATTFTTSGVAAGTYFVRVRAQNAAGLGAASNEVIVTITGGSAGPAPAPSAPAAPIALTAAVTGSAVRLAWARSPSGGAPQSYVIDAGSSSGLSDLASFSTGTAATSTMVPSVPPGTYYVRVRAANPMGTSAPSSEVVIFVGGPTACSMPPDAPAALRAVVNGSTVTLAWAAPAGGPTSYLIEAGSQFGAANLLVQDTGSSATAMVATGVGSGTYFVRIRARNACGTSGVSNEAVVVIP